MPIGSFYLHGWDEFLCVVKERPEDHLLLIEQHRKASTKMSALRKTTRGFLGNAIAVFGAATAAAAAVEGHRRPLDRDLRTLGIDPASFHSVR